MLKCETVSRGCVSCRGDLQRSDVCSHALSFVYGCAEFDRTLPFFFAMLVSCCCCLVSLFISYFRSVSIFFGGEVRGPAVIVEFMWAI